MILSAKAVTLASLNRDFSLGGHVRLDEKRIDGIRNSIDEIVKFKNPLNRTLEDWKRPNGLRIKKITTPIGVIGIIFESRPNVTADVSALSLKSGNCAILRGGSEAFVTDNDGYILDCSFGPSISDPKSLEMKILSIAGVVEVGLFVDICDAVILASNGGVSTLINDSGRLN